MEMISSEKWVSELEMEDPSYMNQYEMNFHMDYILEHNNFQSLSAKSYSSYPDQFTYPQNEVETKPAKQPKINHNSCATTTHVPIRASSSASSHVISFDNSNSSQYAYLDRTPIVKPKSELLGAHGNMNSIPSNQASSHQPQTCSPSNRGTKRTAARSPIHAQDHVIAERKRRENLSQRFIALSALLPGLKKIDKASVLGDAIKYVKHLQERMKILEEHAANRTTESAVFVKRTHYSPNDDTSSSDENFDISSSDQPLPEIEARISGKEFLIRIHCEKKKGCLANILCEIERLNLTIINSSVLPFGNSTLDITVVSQMDVEYNMTVKELVSKLRQALLN